MTPKLWMTTCVYSDGRVYMSRYCTHAEALGFALQVVSRNDCHTYVFKAETA
jgi:hypothetical protein